jgi:hypothetical protein
MSMALQLSNALMLKEIAAVDVQPQPIALPMLTIGVGTRARSSFVDKYNDEFDYIHCFLEHREKAELSSSDLIDLTLDRLTTIAAALSRFKEDTDGPVTLHFYFKVSDGQFQYAVTSLLFLQDEHFSPLPDRLQIASMALSVAMRSTDRTSVVILFSAGLLI